MTSDVTAMQCLLGFAAVADTSSACQGHLMVMQEQPLALRKLPLYRSHHWSSREWSSEGLTHQMKGKRLLTLLSFRTEPGIISGPAYLDGEASLRLLRGKFSTALLLRSASQQPALTLPAIMTSVARMMPSGSEWRQPYTLSNFDFVTESLTLMAGNSSALLACDRVGRGLKLHDETVHVSVPVACVKHKTSTTCMNVAA